MNHPLPARPSFLPGGPAPGSTSAFPLPPSNLVLSAEFPDPSSSGSGADADDTCAICSSSDPKYTCPGCDRPTCSLECSRAHKDKFACSGERDPTKFVALKTYGQGTWADDYRYLEEGRRKVAGWGEGLEKDLAALTTGGPGGARGGRGGAVRGGGHMGRGIGPRHGAAAGDMRQKRTKTDILRSQLLRRGCWVEFMPEGMDRRKTNQSSWNPRSEALHLTVQLSVSPAVLDLGSSATGPSKMLTHHRVLADHPTVHLPTLSDLLEQGPSSSSSATASAAPSTDADATPATDSSPKKSENAVFLIPFYPSPARPLPEDITSRVPRPRPFFPPLDGSKPIAAVLKGTAFIEFPTVQVVSREAYDADLQAGKIALVPLAEPRRKERPGHAAAASGSTGAKASSPLIQVVGQESAPRPPKVAPDAAAAALGALGAYASDEDEEEDGDGLADDDIDMDADGADQAVDGDEDEDEDNGDVLDLAGVIQLEGGPDMLAKVGEALALDFGVPDEDEDGEHEGDDDGLGIREVSTK